MKYKLTILLPLIIFLANFNVFGDNKLSREKENQGQLALAQARHDKKLEAKVKKDERHQAIAELST